MLETLALLAAILVTLTSFALLIIKNWRLCIGLLAIQYIGVFILVFQVWPIQMAITKLIAGWMVCAVFSMAIYNNSETGLDSSKAELAQKNNVTLSKLTDPYSEMSPLFYFLAGILVCLVVLSQFAQLPEYFIDMNFGQAWGLLILIGMGLLKLSFSAVPFKALIGLLTALSGFEVLYASLDSAILTAGLLAIISLGLAITGAYLIGAPAMKEIE